jgi:hypothetical protein
VLVYGLITTFAAPPAEEPRGKRAKIILAGGSFAALIALSLNGLANRSRFEIAVLPAASGQAWIAHTHDGKVLVRDTSPPAAWFQMEQRLVSNVLKLRRETAIDVLYTENATVAAELGHQFPIGHVEPLPRDFTITTARGTIAFSSGASADVVVQPDGVVRTDTDSYRLDRHGLIRIREEEGRLIAIPLRNVP